MLWSSFRPLLVLYTQVALCAGAVFCATAVQSADDLTLYNFVKPMDVVQIVTRDASLPSLTAEAGSDGEILRRLNFNPAVQPSLRLTPQNGNWDWTTAGGMSLRVQNAMDWAVTLEVHIESADGKSLHSSIALPAGPAQTLLVPLQATSPLLHGMRAGPPMPWRYEGKNILLASTVTGELNAAQVVAVTLSMNQPNAIQSILLGRFGVQQVAPVQAAAYANIADAYGQFTRGQWPEKVSSDAQLKAAASKEQSQLKSWLAERPKQDQFGGLLSGPSFDAKGFFRTEKLDGRWYLVTPEGHPFYSLGVNTVAAGNSKTYVEGRESMFAALPKEGEALAGHFGSGDNRSDTGAAKGRAFDHGRWFDFYGANLERSYGPQPIAHWAANTLDRLQAWGFNTIGNWSDPALFTAQRVPYSIPLLIRGDYATISTGLDWWGGMPDPFDPRFALATERAVAIAARDHREDPWLLGYFADNELAWAAPGAEPKARYALAYNTLRLTTDVPAKRAFLKQLRDKYRNQQGLSSAWGIELAAWELMEDPGFQAPLPSAEHPAIEQDLQRFQRLFADTYFKTITDSLQWHSPNHLLLGGRFAISSPEAVAACAQYCDVLSFNFYTSEPQHGYDFAALRALDKPVLVTEFHFGSRDRGSFWGGVSEVYKEEQRAPAYAHFLKQALAEPLIVGVHWFQYLDQPLTGRLLDGENGHLGLVGITDRPFQGFVEGVRKANLAVVKGGLPVPAKNKP